MAGGDDALERELDIPDVLPLLPVRDVVVFPAMMVPLFVAREVSLSYIRSRASDFGIPADWFDSHDIHLHVPAGAIPKDGPSAGTTMACALLSILSRRPCRGDVAMTGEVTLRGRVLAVGGLREKLLAAARAGVKIVCIPEANRRDLLELPRPLRRRLQVVTVSTLEELFGCALTGGAPIAAAGFSPVAKA